MTNRIDTAAERARLAALEGHTPGPWQQGQNNPDRVSKGGEYIANCNPTHQSHPRTENNAHLIAAAPDLKGTLAAALDEIDRLREALSKIASWDWHEIEPHGADIPENVEPWARELDNACTQMQRIARAALRSTEASHDD